MRYVVSMFWDSYHDLHCAEDSAVQALEESLDRYVELPEELAQHEVWGVTEDGEMALLVDSPSTTEEQRRWWESGEPLRVNRWRGQPESPMSRARLAVRLAARINGAEQLRRVTSAAHGRVRASTFWRTSRSLQRRLVASVYDVLFRDQFDEAVYPVAPGALVSRRTRARRRQRQIRRERYCRHFAAITEQGDVIFDDEHERLVLAEGRSRALSQQVDALAQYIHRYGQTLIACGYVHRVRVLLGQLAALRARVILARVAYVRSMYRSYRRRLTRPRRRQARLPRPRHVRPLPPTAPLAPPLA